MGLEPTWKQFAETLVSLRDGKRAPAPPSPTGFGEPMEAPAAATICQDWDLPVRIAAELNGYRRVLEASVEPNVTPRREPRSRRCRTERFWVLRP